MREFEFATRVALPRATYARFAFTPAFDDFVMRQHGLATLAEHAPGDVAAALDVRVCGRHCDDEWRAWRRTAGVGDAAPAALLALAAPRRFRVTPRSAVAAALALVLRSTEDAGVHYDALQFRFEGGGDAVPHVRFFLSARALPALAVEGAVHFFEVDGDATATLQRVRLAFTTGSWLLDCAATPLLQRMIAPDFERMAAAALEWHAQQTAPENM
jgi:hypothetical protein